MKSRLLSRCPFFGIMPLSFPPAESDRRSPMSLIQQQDPSSTRRCGLKPRASATISSSSPARINCSPRSWRQLVPSLQQIRRGYPGKRNYAAASSSIWRRILRGSAPRPSSAPTTRSPAPLRQPGEHGCILRRDQAGDTILGIEPEPRRPPDPWLPVSFSGKLYNVVAYGVDKGTETIDYERWRASPSVEAQESS